MKKYLVLLLALVAASALAETDYVAGRRLDSIRDGKANDDKIRKLHVDGTATIGGATTIGGALTVGGAFGATSLAGAVAATTLSASGATILSSTLTVTGAVSVVGNMNVSGAFTAGSIAGSDLTYGANSVVLNVTNGQPVTLTSGTINVIAPVDGTNNATVGIILMPVTATEVKVPTWILVSTNTYAGGPTTNLLALNASSLNYAGVTVEAAVGGMIMVVPMATNVFYAK